MPGESRVGRDKGAPIPEGVRIVFVLQCSPRTLDGPGRHESFMCAPFLFGVRLVRL